MSRPVVNLFVPCLYPEVGRATLAVLERAGCEVRFDPRQTCCGQPMYRAGFAREAAAMACRHLGIFRGSETVCPAGSCVSFLRMHAAEHELDEQDRATLEHTYDLGQYLVNVLPSSWFPPDPWGRIVDRIWPAQFDLPAEGDLRVPVEIPALMSGAH